MAHVLEFVRCLHPRRSDILWVARHDPRALPTCLAILWESTAN